MSGKIDRRSAEPLENYALLGDMQTAALIGRAGSVDWFSVPRFDSPAVFAALLGDRHSNGHWTLAPRAGESCTRRGYRGNSLVLDSEWDTPEGSVRVIDFMPPRGQAPDIVRIVEGLSGRVPMHTEFRLRFGYGDEAPWVRWHGDRLVAIAGPDLVTVRTPVRLSGQDMATVGDFEVAAGDRIPFVLTYNPSHLPLPRVVDAEQALLDTIAFWADWMRGSHYEGEWQEAVERSLVVLKALTYQPTGGVAAAATTSLPETLGGVRNWDYRYCWLRDTTMTLQALLYTGFVEEARAWREWLLRAIAGDPSRLQIMYGLAGERYLGERELDWLAGYEGSRPVRVGNAASGQFQLDVYGEVIDGLYTAAMSGLGGTEAWDLDLAILDFLEGNWQHPDEGLWEIRGDPQQFVHSKVMAWAGVDRAVRAVEQLGREGPVERWRALRQQIHDEVCSKGYDAGRGTFTQSYGTPHLDSALLLIPQVGFLPPSDPRVIGTVEAVRRELYVDGFVMRYDTSSGVDGLPGKEGSFLACSFWLADDLALIGKEGEGRQLFERLIALRNDVGLLSEEYDGDHKRLIGNIPQAYSHVGLINTARQLSRHGRGSGRTHRAAPPSYLEHRDRLPPRHR